jgi:hypothetical protein
MVLCRLGKNISNLLAYNVVEKFSALGEFVGEKSKPYFCILEEGILFKICLPTVILYTEPPIRRVTVIVDRVVEAGLYKH